MRWRWWPFRNRAMHEADGTRARLRIGLTGGIASGKSTVADMFGALGADIIDTDVIARQVVAPGCAALDEISARFGADVLRDDGSLDRKSLRRLVFSDPSARQDLEAILHPRIREEAWRQADASISPYHIVVVPLLVESPMRDEMHRVLVVDCDEETQLVRLLQRDLESREQAERMIAAQASREERLAIADDVITNDGGLDSTRSQVAAMHEKYLSLVADGISTR